MIDRNTFYRAAYVVLVIIVLISLTPVSALSGYSYYQTINYAATDQAVYQQDVVIHRTTGTAYQETVGGLKVWHIYVGSHCKADYGDVRFTKADGTTLLNYYLWPDYTSSSARFAVRLEGATTAGTLTVHYGNPTATTTSDAGAAPAQYLVPGGHTYTVPSGVTSVSVLVVGGGGGGGAGAGGGGGAGGLIYQTGYSVTPGASLSVTVGAGGPGTANEAARGTSGGNSVFNDLVAIGGGGAGSYSHKNGLLGGSGGGAAYGGSPGSGTAGQGYGGGSGNNLLGGGGGGAGAVGGSLGQPGGIGVAVPITGQSVYYAGGGGPGSNSAGYIPGGLGGGGRGNSGVGENGTDGLGGGGGGAGSHLLGGSGGSGIVIVRAYSATPPSATAFSGEKQPVVAAFSATPLTGTASVTSIKFTDASTNSPTAWSWNFGDGTTSTTRHPTKLYVTPRTYTVALTASNAGGSDIETKTNYITINPNLIGGKNVLYAVEKSATGGGTAWAVAQTAFTPVNMNGLTKTNGMLKIDLKVSRDADATANGVATDEVYIELTSSGAPDANEWGRAYHNPELTTSYKTFYIPLSTFGTAGGELNVAAINFIRVFTKSSTGQGITVSWQNAEIYTPATDADFTVGSSVVAVGSAIPFTDTSLYAPTSWSWDFGDGTTATAQNPTHTYTVPGMYTVSLTASNAIGGSTATKTNVVHVLPAYGDPIKINFQPQASAAPFKYNYDYGQTYRSMGNGWSWGWSVDNTARAVDRNINSDQRYDTFVYITASETKTWEINVPNGYYIVRVSIGDAGYVQRHMLSVEGVQYWNNQVTAANDFSIKSELVQVVDGKLTLTNNGLGTGNTCINYVEITPVSGTPVSVENFDNRVKLTIGADSITEDLTDLPVMLKLSGSSGVSTYDVSRIFDELGSDANRKKIAVTDAVGNPLFTEIEMWDTVNENAVLWTRVPVVSATDDIILYLYYDKDVPDNTLYVDDPGGASAQAVWSNHYDAVWHMVTGSGNVATDSASYGYHGSILASPSTVTGLGGSHALSFRESGQMIDLGTTEYLGIFDDWTIEATFPYPNGELETVGHWRTLTRGHTGGHHIIVSSTGYELGTYSTISGKQFVGTGFNMNTLTGSDWHYLSVSQYDAATMKFIVDGSDVGTITESSACKDVRVIGNYQGGGQEWGTLDEVRVSDTTRSLAWASTTRLSATDSLITYAFEVPTTNFTVTPTEIFRGGSVTFTDTSGFDPIAWNWSFSDGTFSDEQNPTHVFTTPGNYTVLLNATNQYGSMTYYQPNCVRVKDVDFVANTTVGTAPMTVAFADTSGPGVTGWQWNFGDGGTSSVQNPVHTYTAPGDYTVTLTATTPDGNVVTEKIGYVNVRDAYAILDGYDHKMLLRIDYTTIPETLEDVPVKIVLGDSSGENEFNTSFIFDELTGIDDWDQIAVTRADGVTRQYVEVEYWNPIERSAILWTKIPILEEAQNTSVYLYYDADAPENTGYVGGIGSAVGQKVWSNRYLGVWHMVGDTGFVRDSTVNGYDGTISGATPSGAGMQFNGIDNAVIIGDYVYLPSDLTMEADVVFTPTTDPDYYSIVSKTSVDGIRGSGRLLFHRVGGINDFRFDWWDVDAYTQRHTVGIDNFPVQEQNIIGATRSASDAALFTNGELVAQCDVNYTLPLDPYNHGGLWIGSDNYQNGRWQFEGTINDVRISDTVRSDGWMDVSSRSDMDALFTYYQPPTANFTTNTTETNERIPVQFTDASDGNYLVYNWSFGDGQFSESRNPVYAYPTFGNYTVALTVENDAGSDTKTGNILIHNATAVPDFTVNRTEVNEHWPIQFNDTSLGTVFTWDWDFGDGTGSTDRNPVHRYPHFGTYTVNLTTSNDGGTTFEEKTDYIVVHNTTPVAQFSMNRTEVNEHWPIQFTSLSTGTIHDYLWEFGNGVTSTEQNPVYAYPNFGLYTVRLTASNDGGGDTEEKISHVIVHNATPIINDFTRSVNEVEYPVSIHFTPDITGTVHNYYWDFGDGQGSSTSNPDHTYTYAGWFTVELDVTNDGGQDAMTKTTYIRILSYYPTCDWATSFGGDRTLRFIDHSYVGEFDEPITEYSWDFGDGATSTEKNAVHFYPSIGQGDPFHNYFDVTHGVKNARGWTYTTATVDVHNNPNWVPVKPESGTGIDWSPSKATYISTWWNSEGDNLNADAFIQSITTAIQEHTYNLGIMIILFAVFFFMAVAYGDHAVALVMLVLAIPSITPNLIPFEFQIPLVILVGILAADVIYRTIKAVLQM